MVYSNGQSEDEQHHKKFHKRFVEGAQFTVSCSDNIFITIGSSVVRQLQPFICPQINYIKTLSI